MSDVTMQPPSAEPAYPQAPPPPSSPAGQRERLSPLRELVVARIRGFLREPEALFWVFGFPILMSVGLGLAFREKGVERSIVAVVRGSAAERWAPALKSSRELDVRMLDAAPADAALRKGAVAVVLEGTTQMRFRYDPARPESRVARLLADDAVQRAAGATRPLVIAQQAQQTPGSRYIDWVIPGLIGMNLMSTGMWGLGFDIVQARQRKRLKRLISTPMRKRDFMLAQILARLVFIAIEVPPIVLFARFAFGVRIAGSVLSLAVVVVMGAMTFSGVGLLASSRAKTIEGVSGILNVVMMPMFVLSGVFFSASRYPAVVQPVIRALPLTALNDALRTIYNDGQPITAAAVPLAILAAWMVASFAAALRLFRWQ
jgi:ABC-type multidrug transport system permease subunit